MGGGDGGVSGDTSGAGVWALAKTLTRLLVARLAAAIERASAGRRCIGAVYTLGLGLGLGLRLGLGLGLGLTIVDVVYATTALH